MSSILAAGVVWLGVAVPSAVESAILYEASAGFFPPPHGFYLSRGKDTTPAAVDSGAFGLGGGCPAAGTPNYLCGRARSAAGIDGGRLFLKAEARLARSDAAASMPETFTYGDTTITVTAVGGMPATSPGPQRAAFYFRLDGTRVQTRSVATVDVRAFATATLHTNVSVFRQCHGEMECPPGEPLVLTTDSWEPAYGFVLNLRSDAKMLAQSGVSGWAGEAVADFADTLELLAIAILDENGQPRSDITLFFPDGNGDPLHWIPNAPPDPSATTTPTPSATATPAVTASATPGPSVPTPTATAACAGPACEECGNCLDDDGDQLADGADTLDCPASDGGGAGLPAPRGKAALKCQKAIAKAGAAFAVRRAGRVQKCLLAAFTCVQEKPEDACWEKVVGACGRELGALAKDEAKLASAIAKSCGAKEAGEPPSVAVADLRDASGLGYAAAETGCQVEFGIAGLSAASDVAACVTRQHACRIDAALGSAVPRAAELLVRAGRDPLGELPCLGLGADGGLQGLGQPKATRKAATACQRALAAAAGKYVQGALSAVQQCTVSVMTCIQQHPDDPACVAKARAGCAKAVPALAAPGGNDARFLAAVSKACAVPALDALHLGAANGLGFGAQVDECLALGVAPLDTPAQVAACVQRRLSCRTRSLLDLEVPRWRELLTIGQVAAP